METVRVLVIGSGYIAQHLIKALSYEVTYTHRSERAPFSGKAVRMDITDAASIATALWKVLPDVVVNTAALSSPRACEEHKDEALRTNCPVELLEAMFACVPDALLVHLSTDIACGEGQHGDGGDNIERALRAMDKRPVNTYGRSKLEFEKKLVDWPRCVVLRLSNVVGGPAPFTGDGKFVQWLSKEFEKDGVVKLWNDEIRCFVDVAQVVSGVVAVIDQHATSYEPAQGTARARALDAAVKKTMVDASFERTARETYPSVFLHLNVGGPAPLSRVDLGRLLLKAGNFETATVASVSRDSSPEASACPAPLEVVLDSSNFTRFLGVPLVPVEDALAALF